MSVKAHGLWSFRVFHMDSIHLREGGNYADK